MNELDLIVKEIGLLDESAYDVRIKNANNVPDGDIKLLLQCDPVLATVDPENLQNAPESYFRWLLKMFKTYGRDILEASDFIRSLLTSFSEMKNAQGLLRTKDINQIKSIKELEEIVSEAKEKMSSRQKERQARKDKKKLQTTGKEVGKVYLDGGAKLVYMDDEYEIWEPLTYEGSMALGKKTRWCTSKQKDMFDAYMSQGKLFICLPKDGSMKDAFQIHVRPDHEYEIRDANDIIIDLKMWSEWMEPTKFQNILNTVGLSEDDIQWDDDRAENIEAFLLDEFDIVEMNVPQEIVNYANDELNVPLNDTVIGRFISVGKITSNAFDRYLIGLGSLFLDEDGFDVWQDGDIIRYLARCIEEWDINSEKYSSVSHILYKSLNMDSFAKKWDNLVDNSKYDGHSICVKLIEMYKELYEIPNTWLFEKGFIPENNHNDGEIFMDMSYLAPSDETNLILFYEDIIQFNNIMTKDELDEYMKEHDFNIPHFEVGKKDFAPIFEKYDNILEEIYKNRDFLY